MPANVRFYACQGQHTLGKAYNARIKVSVTRLKITVLANTALNDKSKGLFYCSVTRLLVVILPVLPALANFETGSMD
jgi:hypothetical protein